MKPTAKQIAVMELVKTHLSALTRSNDITSPTVTQLTNEFDEDFYNLHLNELELSSGEFIDVSDAFRKLITSIRYIK